MNTDRVFTIAEALAFLAVAYVLYKLWDKIINAASAAVTWVEAKNAAVNEWVGTGSPSGLDVTGTAPDGTPTGNITLHLNPVDTAEIIGNQADAGLWFLNDGSAFGA